MHFSFIINSFYICFCIKMLLSKTIRAEMASTLIIWQFHNFCFS